MNSENPPIFRRSVKDTKNMLRALSLRKMPQHRVSLTPSADEFNSTKTRYARHNSGIRITKNKLMNTPVLRKMKLVCKG